MKRILTLLALCPIAISTSLAICRDDRIGIQLKISDATISEFYATNHDTPIYLKKNDYVLVTEYKDSHPHTEVVLQYGYLMADGAGNFSLRAVNFSYFNPIKLSFFHDHETSPTKGLEGHYNGSSTWERGVIYLSSLRCSYNDFWEK